MNKTYSQRYSNLLGKTIKETPSGIEAQSHLLLLRGGFVDGALAAGIYSFLPLGFRVHQKIAEVIREEINNIGGQELLMPVLNPKGLWEESGRWEAFTPPLFKVTDQFDREFCLAPTHEEIISDIARRFIHSYKDLPFSAYHIQDKFRNEKRSSGGLLRTREFWMKDLYSFHTDQKSLDEFYSQAKQAYTNIFNRCGIEPVIVSADSGSIGGAVNNEFMAVTEIGEDRIAECTHCHWGANFETLKNAQSTQLVCAQCGSSDIKESRAIEIGHIFQLGTTYSKKMNVSFTNQAGIKEFTVMGCYGIGLGRLLATAVEINHDDKGIIWPKDIAPFNVHLIGLNLEDEKVKKAAEKLYANLTATGTEVLYDDREDVTAGVKLKDADLIGCPYRIVISKKTVEENKLELKLRKEAESKMVTEEELVAMIS
jgi:prolyl-tRNA synthetase